MISQIFVLSPQGDSVIFKDFRGDVPKSGREAFFARARTWRGAEAPCPDPLPAYCEEGRDAPPAFCIDGVHYLHVRRGGLWWVAATRRNASPGQVLELLLSVAGTVQDVLGGSSEDAIRRNLFMVYEVLDELLDGGVPRSSSAERLRRVVRAAPARGPALPGVAGAAAALARARGDAAAGAVARGEAGGGGAGGGAAGGGLGGEPGGVGGAGALSRFPGAPPEVFKSVLDVARTGAREEIFVDVVERLSVVFDASGAVRSSGIAGRVQVQSYLPGAPEITLGFCDALELSRDAISARGSARQTAAAAAATATALAHANRRTSAVAPDDPVVLDSWAVHEAADGAALAAGERTLTLRPPEGHFVLLSYTSSRPFRPPIALTARVEDDAYSADRLLLRIRLVANFPPTQTATAVAVSVPLPRGVARATASCTILQDPPAGGGGVPKAAFGFGPRRNAGASSFASPSAHATSASRLSLFASGRRRAAAPPPACEGEWSEAARAVRWTLRDVAGGTQVELVAKLDVAPDSAAAVRRTYGPVAVQFALPGKPSPSGLDVKYLRIAGPAGAHASRWFRVVTAADAYLLRPNAL